MLIDDVPFNLIPLEVMLESHSITVQSFYNGQDAISYFQKRLQSTCCRSHIRLVLTDIQMPIMDGYKVAEHLTFIETYFFDYMKRNCLESVTKAKRNCPIIAVTANSDQTVKEKAAKVRITAVFAKPMTSDQIASVVNEYYYK